jgi:transcription initiation factor TFIID subunit TAF12
MLRNDAFYGAAILCKKQRQERRNYDQQVQLQQQQQPVASHSNPTAGHQQLQLPPGAAQMSPGASAKALATQQQQQVSVQTTEQPPTEYPVITCPTNRRFKPISAPRM